MKKMILIFILSLLPPSVFAGSWGVAGGMNMNMASNTNPAPLNIDLKPGLGFQIGTFYSHRFEKFRLRALAQLRTLRVRNREAGYNMQVYSMQLALPLLFQQMLTKRIGYFVGPDFGFNLNTESTRNDAATGLKFNAVTTSAMAGFTYKLTKKLYVDLYYSYGMTELADNIVPQAIGFQFVTYFSRQKNIR